MNKKERLGSNPLDWIENTKNATTKTKNKKSLGSSGERAGKQQGMSPRNFPAKKEEDTWKRATFIIRQANIDNLKFRACEERTRIKNVLDEILNKYFMSDK